MEINPFILALSKTLPESCLQGLAVYLILQLLFWVDKRSTPLLKFNIFYMANWCLFAGFVYTFFHHYQQIQVTSFKPDSFPSKIGNAIETVTIKPNLWLQISFWTNHYAYIITGFYLLGLLFCMLKLTIGIINISWFKNNKYLKLDNYLTQISIQLSSNFKLIKTVPVYLSDKIFVPLTLGFIKPIIVFPIALINQLSAEQTEAILLHELAHIKRNDYLLNILLCIVQSFLFFNPAIWLMKREINQYREQCCDDFVLDNTAYKLDYARALLLIEESRSTQLTFALASNGEKYNLLNRIKRITNMKTNEPSPQNKFVVLLLALIVIGAFIACNFPVKKGGNSFVHTMKRPVYKTFSVKITEMTPHTSNWEWSADSMTIIGKSEHNSAKFFTNKISFKPNKKFNKKVTFLGEKINFNLGGDTIIKSKNKIKIVLEDSLGNKKEYNSLKELPLDIQKELLKENRKSNQIHSSNSFHQSNDMSLLSKMNDQINNQIDRLNMREDYLQWKLNIKPLRDLSKELRRRSNSPESKKHTEEIQKQSEELRKQTNSPEVRKQMEKLQKQSGVIEEQINQQLNSPEFKKQIGNLNVQVGINYKLKDGTLKYYQSLEWKTQEKNRQKLVDSARRNWKSSSDFQPLPVLPEKVIVPENLN